MRDFNAMLDAKIQDALNKHLNEELFSAYVYMSMGAYFESLNLSGMAQWMNTQVQEELVHASKFVGFIHDRGGRVILAEIAAPKTDWDSPLNAFEEAYAHERHISSCIGKLLDLAIAENDHPLNTFLQWFVNEQVEEEATVEAIVQKLKLVGDNGVALFMLDGELGKRTAMEGAE
jgi:ferritin